MADDMGRGIVAPASTDQISTNGVTEMRTLGTSTASAISDSEARTGQDIETEVATAKSEAISAASTDATQKASAAKTEAISDSTRKYGDLPGRVKGTESKTEQVEPGPGYRVRDSTGRVAFEVDEHGGTHVYDPAFALPDSGPVRTNSDAKFQPSDPEPATYYPTHMDPWDRSTMISYNSSYLRYSRDEGETWLLSHYFDTPVRSGIILENGEVLVANRGVEDGAGYEMILSRGWQDDPANAEWTTVHSRQIEGGPSGAFSYSQHKNIVLFAEYGPKLGQAGVSDAARYVYLSRDYGKTWSQILDILEDNPELTQPEGIHLHGAHYDPYWDRIWVTYGDDEQGTVFSDDLGKTWEVADHTTDPNGPNQFVGIISLPKCVLFASDGHPNGVARVNRSDGKRGGKQNFEVAYLYDGVQGLTILCQSIWKAQRPGDDAPAVFEFVSAPADGHRFILTTVDGYEFNKVWENPEVTRGNSSGRAYGPTASGQLLHYTVENTFESTTRAVRKGPMPNAY